MAEEYVRVCLTIKKSQKETLDTFSFINQSGLYQTFLDKIILELNEIMKDTDGQIVAELNRMKKKKEDQNP